MADIPIAQPGNPTNKILVRFIIVAATLTGTSAPIAGSVIPATDIPGVLDAAKDAGISAVRAVFESSDESILSIDKDGVASPRKAGRVNVTIKDPVGRRTARVSVEVLPKGSAPPPSQAPQPPASPPAPSVINPTEIKLRASAGVAVGGTTRLEPFVTPYNATRSSLKWSSSDAAVATVSADGRVTGLKAGSARITVTDSSGNIKAESTVSIRADSRPTTSITLSRQALTLNVGASSALAVTYRPQNATIRGVTWTSNSSSIARVDPDGKITGVSAGTATISAISDSGARIASCVVTVVVPVEAVTLPEQRITLRIGQTHQLRPVVTPTNATAAPATYRSSSTTVATVSSTGLITARRAGTTTITITLGGKSATCTVTVVRS